VKELIEVVRGRQRNGHRRATARLISLVENNPAAAREVIGALFASTGQAHIIGITGPPGSGKSTLVNEIAKQFRQLDTQVGIVAVDPSSPFTGGALLGDRVRMRDLSGDNGIFIRSMASRGNLGGLAETTGNVIKVLDAAGFEVILVETVGAGQAEVEIASTAHTTLVIEAPGMGDEIQSIKAGILEIADILVVNKADRPGSEKTVKALKMMLHMGDSSRVNHHGRKMVVLGQEAPPNPKEAAWQIPVLETVALDGQGVAQVVESVRRHKEYLRDSGEWLVRELARSRQEVRHLLQARFIAELESAVSESEREMVIAAVAARQLDPYSAVARLFDQAYV
jgi:LAO/AO transport system kinase